MNFVARSKNVRFSPFKLRPLVDVIRGKDVTYALNWLSTCRMKKVLPIQKVVQSAVANAFNKANVEKDVLWIKEIRVDQGPTLKYFKPGAMGRGNALRRRLSHISIVLESKEEKRGTEG